MKITKDMVNEELRGILSFPASDMLTPDGKLKAGGGGAPVFSPPLPEGMTLTEISIPRSDGGENMKVNIYTPKQRGSEPLPGVVWIHGGGYAFGTARDGERTISTLMSASPCVVVAPEYTTSLVKPYPAALHDCYDALVYLADNTASLNVRPDKLMVGGESAGGGLAAAVAIYARDMKQVKLCCQICIYPMLDCREITESSQAEDAILWTREVNHAAWEAYLGSYSPSDAPCYASPSLCTDYSALPPLIGYVGNLDIFRDESLAYCAELNKLGISVDFEVYDGAYHGFDVIYPRSQTGKMAQAFLSDAFRRAVDM